MIYCEGLSENSYIHMAFSDSSEEYLDLYCRCDWESCRIARMLTEKAEAEGF